MRPRRLYLAGPMSGLPDYNRPAFHNMAAFFRHEGYAVSSPAENTIPSWTPRRLEWLAYMAQSIPQMLRCDVVAALDGWEKSKGARLEMDIAKRLRMPCYSATTLRHTFDEWGPVVDDLRDCGVIQ